jgi:hypothetical protein
MKNKCRSCEKNEAKVGVYCCKCMAEIRRFVKREKENYSYWQANNFGSGDLWRTK